MEQRKPCKHLWVNKDGCLLCPATWEEMNKEGYFFKPVNIIELPEQRSK